MTEKSEKKPELKAEKQDDGTSIVEVKGKRMRTNPNGLVVVVCKRAHEAYFPGDVHGLEPIAAHRSIVDGESELHVSSVVDHPSADDDTEDDQQPATVAGGAEGAVDPDGTGEGDEGGDGEGEGAGAGDGDAAPASSGEGGSGKKKNKKK